MLSPEIVNKISFDVSFVSNQEIQNINFTWRKKDSPTDVLSFPLLSPQELLLLRNFSSAERKKEIPFFYMQQLLSLGDIVISVMKAQEQAIEENISLHEKVDTLLIHGFLHLLGYDHEVSKREEEIMLSLEEGILLHWRNRAQGGA